MTRIWFSSGVWMAVLILLCVHRWGGSGGTMIESVTGDSDRAAQMVALQ